jgi:plasmid stabilization system protein ParE
MATNSWDVIWIPNAEQKLAALWVQSADRQAIAVAANLIDGQLESTPESAGESRPNGRRILHSKPLGITYRVLLAQRQVQVLRVWLY